MIYALGYRYCKAKVLHFIFTEGAGHTECRPEYAYEMKWKDECLNTLTRKIDRPHACHLCFSSCNMIYVLNQSCQSELILEKHWITFSGFFWLITSLFGITVVDAWKGYLCHKKIKLLDIVDMMLCKDMIENKFYNGKAYTSGTTYSICPPPPSKKRPALDNIDNRHTGRPRDCVGGELLNGDSLLDEDHDFEMVNDSQISDLTLDPCDFQRRSTHSLVKTKDR